MINDNNNFTGDDLIVVTIGDLNLVSAMIRVYEYKYNFSISSNIDSVINGLLPFDMTLSGLTGCVCQGLVSCISPTVSWICIDISRYRLSQYTFDAVLQ